MPGMLSPFTELIGKINPRTNNTSSNLGWFQKSQPPLEVRPGLERKDHLLRSHLSHSIDVHQLARCLRRYC